MKKALTLILAGALSLTMLAGCGKQDSGSSGASGSAASFDKNKAITVVARDSASGTRTAFHELMNIIQKEGDQTVDKLVTGALEFDSTDKVITAVEGDQYGIGYISLGSVSDRIKAIQVNGVEPTVANVKSGDYKVSRPFLLVTKKDASNELAADFIDFILSAQGQTIVEENKYIKSSDDAKEYTGSGKKGTIKLAGSTSVQPLMEKLTEAYKKINPDVTFEIQAQGSSQGIKAATDGTYDIGMSSRELKDEEKSALDEHTIALDGIAVIVNKANPVTDLASEKLTAIYTGTATKWSEVE